MKSLDEFISEGMMVAQEKHNQTISDAIEAAEAQRERDIEELTRVARLLYCGVRDPKNPEPEPAPTTSTEAIKSALRHLPAVFTRDDLFLYVREHFPSKEIRDNLPSCFSKMVRHQRDIRASNRPGMYEQISLIQPDIEKSQLKLNPQLGDRKLYLEGGEPDEPEQANTRRAD